MVTTRLPPEVSLAAAFKKVEKSVEFALVFVFASFVPCTTSTSSPQKRQQVLRCCFGTYTADGHFIYRMFLFRFTMLLRHTANIYYSAQCAVLMARVHMVWF